MEEPTFFVTLLGSYIHVIESRCAGDLLVLSSWGLLWIIWYPVVHSRPHLCIEETVEDFL